MNLEENGFALVSGFLGDEERETLIAVLGSIDGAGRRGLLALPAVRSLANSARLLDLLHPHLLQEPRPVRALYFDKTQDSNWGVPWHQDLTIALRTQIETPGFGPWSVKDDIPHVQPPAELLAQMLTVRIHLDATDESNGALRILPGSHRNGRLSPQLIQRQQSAQPAVACIAAAGDALLMRPLLLHASSRSTSARHRRVLHIEYAGFTLPAELAWHEAA
jgi:hypothetical protein